MMNNVCIATTFQRRVGLDVHLVDGGRTTVAQESRAKMTKVFMFVSCVTVNPRGKFFKSHYIAI